MHRCSLQIPRSLLYTTSRLKLAKVSALEAAKPSLRFSRDLSTTSIRRTSECGEIGAVNTWRDDMLAGKGSLFWDCMDSRQLTLLDQTIRPHLPATYRNLPCDSKLGDVAQDTALPTAAHLVYFPSYTNEFELSSDGYLADEAPPHPFTQRVWAGGLMVFNPNNPLRVGQLASQRKRVVDVRFKEKHGSDPLVLVRLALEMRNAQGPSTTEYRDLAYMKPVHLQSKVVKHRRTADFSHKLVPTEIFLFRYSALTWNSHRIHYDTRYAKEVEHHPGLLVHGPLTCTMLLQLLDCHMPENMVLKSFEYRATSPMYCQEPMLLNGRWMTSSVRATTSGALVDGARQCELWSTNNEGGITMRGVATLVPL